MTPLTEQDGNNARWLDWLLALAVALAYTALALPGLAEPAKPIFDEILHVFAANDWLRDMPMSDNAHPPGARMMIALGLWLGPGAMDLAQQNWTTAHAWAWRLPGVLAGSLTLAVLYGLTRALGGSRLAALAATVLLGLDGAFFVHSRIGMTNTYSMLWTALAALFTWRALKDDRPAWLLATGLALGLAIGTRWTGLFATCGLVALVAWTLIPRFRHQPSGPQLDRWLLCGVLGFGVLPGIGYGVVSLPMLWPAGISPFKATGWEAFFKNFVLYNQFLLNFHEYKVLHHPAHSPWWQWPWMTKPLWYFYASRPEQREVLGILTAGNPFLWLASVPAWALTGYLGIREKRLNLLFPAVMGLTLWLPWTTTGRGTTFSTYFTECLPYATISVVLALQWLTARASQRAVVGAWLGGSLAWFIWMHPLYTSQPLSIDQLERRLPFPSWDLMRQTADFRAQHHLESNASFGRFARTMGNKVWRAPPPGERLRFNASELSQKTSGKATLSPGQHKRP